MLWPFQLWWINSLARSISQPLVFLNSVEYFMSFRVRGIINMSQNQFPSSEATDWFVYLWILWFKYCIKQFLGFFFSFCASLSLCPCNCSVIPSNVFLSPLCSVLVSWWPLRNGVEWFCLHHLVNQDPVLSWFPRDFLSEDVLQMLSIRAGVWWGFRSAYLKPAVLGLSWYTLVFKDEYKSDLHILQEVSAFMKVEYEWVTLIFIISFK